MRRYHGHEKALAVERRVWTLARDPVSPQVNESTRRGKTH